LRSIAHWRAPDVASVVLGCLWPAHKLLWISTIFLFPVYLTSLSDHVSQFALNSGMIFSFTNVELGRYPIRSWLTTDTLRHGLPVWPWLYFDHFTMNGLVYRLYQIWAKPKNPQRSYCNLSMSIWASTAILNLIESAFLQCRSLRLRNYTSISNLINKKLIRRWDDNERELSLRRHCTRTKNTIDSCINSATDRFLKRRFTKVSEITQCNGHYAVQDHSRSPILVPIESSWLPISD